MNKRYSAQKMMIEDALMKLDHPTATEIYEYIREFYPNISLGTVYRNLGLMAESGEVLRITLGDAPDRFDINTHDHIHVMCRKCGEVFDAEIDNLKELLTEMDQYLEGYTGVHIENRSMYFKGVCSSCREQS
ncbi:Fur family transcriptional regulator [Tepidimicrobium xylanilyticum]|uniref:Fur family transcriptional regulator, peroxide stress response regulator n=1 Tax=Tepidimicrobium xylanilyticum TaxID=1123352 RepID=A0A1H2WQJ1_9FIRM|nr:transcriptional repressor [Tepidimicrobium xylanilyticum]GMG95175.1 transcriptional repressor [Tepidimicrobium xylanilyticum]SDW82933.1 Fur family transcriptional regulator, peroxide stress response regulator [Tepidimicrobium xylanilyticum]